MKVTRPVFIVGPSRSGTSLLYRMLQKHPVFKPQNCPVGVDLSESKVFFAPETVYDKEITPGVGAFSYMLFNDFLFSEFQSELGWVARWQKMLGTSVLSGERSFLTRRLLNLQFIRMAFWKFYQGPAMARCFFQVAKKARGVERILEKTPQHIQRISEIMYTYPESRIIGIVRHPIDVFTSYRRRYNAERQSGASPDQLAWLNITPDQFCAGYAVEESIIRQGNNTDDGSFTHVRYEDLTANPKETLQRILFFLGESYDEQCVVKNETGQFYWDIDPHLFDEVHTKTKDWREYIKQHEAEYIECALKLPMRKLGYERYT